MKADAKVRNGRLALAKKNYDLATNFFKEAKELTVDPANLAAIDAWQKAWETDNGPVPRSDALEEDARERIRQSLAARWMCRSGSI